MNCSSCGRENPDDVAYCLDCGRKLEKVARAGNASSPPEGGRPCSRCGADNPGGMNFCKRCGAPLNVEPGSIAEGSEPGGARLCPGCQGVLDRDARFCKYCGNQLGAESSAPAAESSAPAESSASAESSPPAAESSAPDAPGRRDSTKTGPLGSASPRAASLAKLVTILKDGSEGQSYALEAGTSEIGREEGSIRLPEDPYMSPRHARLTAHEGRFYIKDLVSSNGIFINIREPSRLHHHDVILMGQQVLRFEVLAEAEQGLGPASQHGTLIFGTPESGCLGRLCQLTTEGIVRDVYHLRSPEVLLGREGRDVVFPDDPFISRRHARITYETDSRSFILEDLDSSNGTSLRFRGERELRSGDQFRVGNHLFRFDVSGGGR